MLRNIAAAAEAAAEAGIPLEVCGEAASDPLTVPLLVGLGATSSRCRSGAGRDRPGLDPRASSYRDARVLAAQAVEAVDAAEVERLARVLAPAG